MVFLPGTISAADRFVRTSFFLDAIPKKVDPNYIKSVPKQSFTYQAIASVLSVMRAVSPPLGMHTADKPNVSSTVWRTVADHKNLVYYFDSATRPNTFWVSFAKLNLKPGAPVRKLSSRTVRYSPAKQLISSPMPVRSNFLGLRQQRLGPDSFRTRTVVLERCFRSSYGRLKSGRSGVFGTDTHDQLGPNGKYGCQPRDSSTVLHCSLREKWRNAMTHRMEFQKIEEKECAIRGMQLSAMSFEVIATAVLLLLGLCSALPAHAQDYDLVINNGRVIETPRASSVRRCLWLVGYGRSSSGENTPCVFSATPCQRR
jgi:hypothetical protein